MSDKSKEERNGQLSVTNVSLPADVKKSGVLRKLKTMKKKYFVLRLESDSGPARLEYYDNEKKYRAGISPKRSISIKKCFNINRKVDAKQKLAIALYTKDDCFSVVAESEQSLDDWLKAMLELQLDTPSVNGNAALKPKFEHVWQVSVGDKSLGGSRSMKGLYRLCLTNTCLNLVKVEQSDTPESLEFPLMGIRRCGHSNNYFFFELGRSSITGAGEFWLETEDVVIAQNMHEVTLNAMKTCREHEDMGPHRPRSSSNTETSRPIATRRPIAVVNAQPSVYPSIRNRCDSMPSRPRTISEGQHVGHRGYSNPPLDALRSHMGYSHSVSYSPPGLPNPLSPSSTCCSTDSAGSSLSIDDHDGLPEFLHLRYSHNVPTESAIPTEPPIKEEQFDYMCMGAEGSAEKDEYMQMGPLYSASVPNDRSLYLNLNPSQNSHSNTSASNTSDYMDMTSPMSLPGDYMHMSPLGSEAVKTSLESALSIHSNMKATTEGYLYMAPVVVPTTTIAAAGCKDGYLEMSPLSTSLPKPPSILSGNMDMFNMKDSGFGISDTSLASSSDVKAEVYQLDKVKSLLTQTEDASEDYIRPVRAYSMGSRPQVKKTHLTIHDDSSRIRAYSVGSQAASARNKILNSADKDLGSMKGINMRAGSKSSSAPLLHQRPPRLRASGSRADMDEDLMEIDYNKTRSYTNNFQDRDFTIEPVGRSRSGSCSSSSAASSFSEKVDRRNKMIYERDKPGIILKGKNIYNSLEMANDYLPMSPLSNSKPWLNSDIQFKTSEQSLSGDYVSLNPLVNYMNSKSTPITSAQSVMSWKPNITCDSSALSPGSKEVAAARATENSGTKPSGQGSVTTSNHINASVIDAAGYMCMDFRKAAAEDPVISIEDAADVKQEANISFDMSPSVLKVKKNNTVPRTPPPSPGSGAGSSPSLSSKEKNHLSNLKIQLAKVATQSAPNSRPTSTSEDLWLNYASLDLSPPSDEDTSIMPVHRTRPFANSDTKEVPLSYAKIDFSQPCPNSLQDKLSHL